MHIRGLHIAVACLLCVSCARREVDGQRGFVLTRRNSVLMTGQDDPQNERWSDIAGNFYSTEFARNFSYENPESTYRPVVRARVEPRSDTFRGRIEAHGLKPNFCYQLKLMGDYERDLASYETIGYLGRWRLPGRGTNYTDQDYERFPDKARVSAYILFDWFVTDAEGRAVRDFSLCQSYHVMWHGARSSSGYMAYSPPRVARVRADNPELYLRPKSDPLNVALCAEVEIVRYAPHAPNMRLPPGRYAATLGLTEESFHSNERGDGGYWATVLQVPVEFEVTE